MIESITEYDYLIAEDYVMNPVNTLSRRTPSRVFALVILAMLSAFLAPAYAQLRDATTGETPMWNKLRSGVFDNRPINMDGESVLTLEAPARAEDAATVPMAIRTKFEQSDKRYVKTMWLLIENNPSPVAAIFHFTPQSGRADIETRVRVEEYSPVRAVAELSDGKLYAVSQFIKASGGCSAPAGKDAVLAKANLGKMRLKVEAQQREGGPVLAQLMISHPNDSGLAMDQVTRTFDQPHFVRRVEVSYAGNTVMTADVDFSISENPNFRFYFLPKGDGALEAKVIDTKDLSFSSRVLLNQMTVSKAP
jgi:sulfur-oxidizing protein SoxY